MIQFTQVKNTVRELLETYTGVPVILANQVAKIPPYPFISFTITTPLVTNAGTWGRWSDGYNRKQIKQIWSITAQSDNPDEAAETACKAHDFFDIDFYDEPIEGLSDNDIAVVRVGNVTNRDNFLTVNYEYRCGFDVTLSFLNEMDRTETGEGEIDDAPLTRI